MDDLVAKAKANGDMALNEDGIIDAETKMKMEN
jgi:hypothetical protein